MIKKILTIDALKVKYNDVTFYVAVISSAKLFSICEVSRADEDTERGYQRLLGTARAKKIADYINAGNVIPGALILSAQENIIKSFDVETKKLKFIDSKGSFLVIDGQHRLYGAHQSAQDIPIPVCIFDKLEKSQEVQYFLDVNGQQRGVPKTLQLELTKFTAKPESKEETLIRLFDALDEDPSSPLAGKLSRTKSVAGKLSHVPFQASFSGLLEKSPLGPLNFEQKKMLIINFLAGMEEILIEEFASSEKLINAAFFQALMQIFNDACNHAMYKHKKYTKAAFREVLSGIAEIHFASYSGTNKKSIGELTAVMRDKVHGNNNFSDDLF